MIAWLLVGFVYQAVAGDQPVEGGGRQRQVRGHRGRLARGADYQFHRQIGVVLLGLQQGRVHRGGRGAGLPAVGAGVGHQRLDVAAAIGFEQSRRVSVATRVRLVPGMV